MPKGTDIIIHTVGLHYNRNVTFIVSSGCFDVLFTARYWEDPHRFKPARFLEDWPREAFVPFSLGAFLIVAS